MSNDEWRDEAQGDGDGDEVPEAPQPRVMSEAEALKMAQPVPSKLTSVIKSFSIAKA